MRIGGESTGKKLRKRVAINKCVLWIKTGRKTDKTPCFSLCKTENFIVQISRNFLQEISGSDGGDML